MAGIVPSTANGDPQWLEEAFQSVFKVLPQDIRGKVSPGKQLGPWFYAPYLTSFVTPLFLSFLVGPSRMNRRVDGALGGIVVEVWVDWGRFLSLYCYRNANFCRSLVVKGSVFISASFLLSSFLKRRLGFLSP